MDHANDQPRFPLCRGLALLAACGLGGALLSAVVLSLAGSAGLLPVTLLTGAICLSAAAVALVPMSLLSDRDEDGPVQGAMVATLVRPALSFGGVGLAAVITSLPTNHLLAATLGWYLLLMTVEAGLFVRFLKRQPARTLRENAAW